MAIDRAREPALPGTGDTPVHGDSRTDAERALRDRGSGAQRSRRAILPLAVVGGVLAGGTLLAVGQDAVRAAVPPCPFRMLTGLDCPFCGGTRAVLALLHGDITGAADYNLLVTVAAFLGAAALVWWALGRLAGLPWPPMPARRTRAVAITGLALVCAFWVGRNLPNLAYLASAT